MSDTNKLIWPFVVRCHDCTYQLERTIAIPPPFRVDGLNLSEIESMEEDIWVCPSDCGYYEKPTEPLYTFNYELQIDDPEDDDDKPDLPRQLPLWPE